MEKITECSQEHSVISVCFLFIFYAFLCSFGKERKKSFAKEKRNFKWGTYVKPYQSKRKGVNQRRSKILKKFLLFLLATFLWFSFQRKVANKKQKQKKFLFLFWALFSFALQSKREKRKTKRKTKMK